MAELTGLRNRGTGTGRWAVPGEFQNPLEESTARDLQYYNPKRSEYKGMRTTSKGEEVMADMAINALRTFYHATLPIFEYEEGLELHTNLPSELVQYISSGNYITKKIDPNEPKPRLQSAIREGASGEEKERFIVFALTSSIHAILCILSTDGILYTVGFGYNSAPQQGKILNALRNFRPIGESVAHAIEEITGALYTADYLLPANTQACKISWVGYLDEEICDRLETYLAQTQAIVYSLERIKANKFSVTQECTLIVNKTYSEAAGFINRNATNCIKWLQTILGVQLNCGLVDNPDLCMGIEEGEWTDLADGIQNGDYVSVYNTITEIQHRLKPNVCKQGWQSIRGVCKFVGLVRGGRKTRKIGKNRKNKRKNKSRSHKKSRTCKRK